jgi:hypothetical protein
MKRKENLHFLFDTIDAKLRSILQQFNAELSTFYFLLVECISNACCASCIRSEVLSARNDNEVSLCEGIYPSHQIYA